MANTFSEESIQYFQEMYESNFSTTRYHELKHLFNDNVIPEIVSILEQVKKNISKIYRNLDFEGDDEHLGRGYGQAGPAKFGWGAIVREGKTKHSDLQLFLALRHDYIRYGFYLPSTGDFQTVFNSTNQRILGNRALFDDMLEDLKSEHGLILGRKTMALESGEPAPMRRNYPDYPDVDILEEKELSILGGIPTHKAGTTDLVDLLTEKFLALKPMYDFLMI